MRASIDRFISARGGGVTLRSVEQCGPSGISTTHCLMIFTLWRISSTRTR